MTPWRFPCILAFPTETQSDQFDAAHNYLTGLYRKAYTHCFGVLPPTHLDYNDCDLSVCPMLMLLKLMLQRPPTYNDWARVCRSFVLFNHLSFATQQLKKSPLAKFSELTSWLAQEYRHYRNSDTIYIMSAREFPIGSIAFQCQHLHLKRFFSVMCFTFRSN
nr:Caab081 [Calliteara abietis nucleopolyhedrovirus]